MIGLFDSGVGGLTVVAELLKQLPDYNFVYLADTARAPYGSRDPETIRQFVREDCAFLQAHGATIIVAASNTNTTHRASNLRESVFVPVIGTIAPQFGDVIRSATKNGRVGILATDATMANGRYQRLVDEQGFQAFAQSCPKLVPFIEVGELDSSALVSALEEYVEPLLAQHVDTIILGCTHYPMVREQIQKIVGSSITLIDPAATCITGLAWYLSQHPEIETKLSKNKQHVFFSTKPNPAMQRLAEQYLGISVEWKSAVLA